MSVKPARTRTGIGLLSYPRGPDGHSRTDDGIAPPRLGCPRCDGSLVVRRRLHLLLGRTAAEPAASRDRSTCFRESSGRQHGGQGGSLRHCELGALRHRDHGRELRRRELHARFLYAVGRHGADGEHPVGRSGLWRRRAECQRNLIRRLRRSPPRPEQSCDRGRSRLDST
jgi:hypothetical protein